MSNTVFDIGTIRGKMHALTQDEFWRTIRSRELAEAMQRVRQTKPGTKEYDEAKKRLPIVTWQAHFTDGRRSNKSAVPSGLYMLDIDHVANPAELYETHVAAHLIDCFIGAVHITPSIEGLRLVGWCPPECNSLAECQKWLAQRLGLTDYDAVCKDMARASFLVPFDMFLYIDNAIFNTPTPTATPEASPDPKPSQERGTDDEEGCGAKLPTDLFGNEMTEYKGLPITDIARNWLKATGGEPVEGERNQRLYQLACSLRYVTDFNPGVMFNNMPRYGLPDTEVRQIIHSALSADRTRSMPKQLKEVITAMLHGQNGEEKESREDETASNLNATLLGSDECLPESLMPPLFRQLVHAAPKDFKTPTYMALLPLLGTLASRLRAQYFDGVVHSPSFQTEVEAPMAAGKSFTRRLYDQVMNLLKISDTANRERENDYKRRLKLAKNDKIQPAPEMYPIRLIPATASITQILRRMANAKGAHLLSFTDEIRIVLESYGRGAYGNLRALMRNAFDNAEFGQDFANSDAPNDYVKVFMNTLHAGTPAEYAKFYNNVEDGTVSRVLFVSLPDQFGKQFPKWRSLSAADTAKVERCIADLNATTMDGDDVKPATIMLRGFDFMAKWAEKWCRQKQKVAVKCGSRDLDTFMRRSAVVGFRAAMIVWYLLGQKATKQNMEMTQKNAEWVAEYMLWQLMRRYETTQTSNTIRYFDVWTRLGSTFSTDQLAEALQQTTYHSSPKEIIRCWKMKGLVSKKGGNYEKK